ncbi:MAG: quinone-dependent dihydroorotate dehydrogenase [Brevundimonas sp.]|uniref:quinone-dependent dihydroorotate dehydrogenase n=1 Tax=Brevundimonas sp. TaxID=1871086 RepID=UPI00391C2237
MSAVHDLGLELLRALDPEQAHTLALKAVQIGLGPRAPAPAPALRTTLAGLSLPSPIGLAAGFDKDAVAIDGLLSLGFGFIECGSVTPRPQSGNPRPRLFRLSEDRAVINRMGFNNEGLEPFARRLEAHLARGRVSGVVGANLGANKDSEDRTVDYVTGLQRLWGLADYFTINISSPNTPGLRALQGDQELARLLDALAEARARLSPAVRAPLFLKIAPDLDAEAIGAIVASVIAHGLDGMVVSNTTLERPETLRSPHAPQSGGLSGAPLKDRALKALSHAAAAADGRLALIAAGGIETAGDVEARLQAGAHAVQIYSALVFEGPGLIARLNRDLARAAEAGSPRTR